MTLNAPGGLNHTRVDALIKDLQQLAGGTGLKEGDLKDKYAALFTQHMGQAGPLTQPELRELTQRILDLDPPHSTDDPCDQHRSMRAQLAAKFVGVNLSHVLRTARSGTAMDDLIGMNASALDYAIQLVNLWQGQNVTRESSPLRADPAAASAKRLPADPAARVRRTAFNVGLLVRSLKMGQLDTMELLPHHVCSNEHTQRLYERALELQMKALAMEDLRLATQRVIVPDGVGVEDLSSSYERGFEQSALMQSGSRVTTHTEALRLFTRLEQAKLQAKL